MVAYVLLVLLPVLSTSMSTTLKDIYAAIAKQSDEIQSAWPQNEAFCRLLHRTDEGILLPPRFDDGHGPIGLYALLKDNAPAQAILRTCTSAMDEFFQQYGVEAFYRPPPETFHICVTIFQEHPSLLLDEAIKKMWIPVDEPLSRQLAKSLKSGLDGTPKAPELQLHSVFWTPDGALIAGFLEDNDACFSAIRQKAASIAEQVLNGKLTSRPKKLIHVTLGRVLNKEKLLPGASDAMLYCNREKFPRLVQDIVSGKVAGCNGGCVVIDTVSLIREVVWMCNEFNELDTMDLITS